MRGTSRYQYTAYFLDWLEYTYGEGTVVYINKQLEDRDYCDDMWVRLSGGKSVHELWDMYCDHYGLSQAKSGCKGKAKGVEPIAEEAAAAMDKTAPLAMGVKPIPVYNAAPRLPPPDRTEVVIDQETEPMAPGSPLAPSLAATIDSESSYSPFPFRGESALAEIFTKRLKKLTFDGVRDGRRFIKVVCSSHVVWIGTA